MPDSTFRLASRFEPTADQPRAIDELCAFADLTATPSWDKDPLYESTRHVRDRAADVRRAREEGRLDLDGWEAILVRLVSSGEFKDVRRRCGRKADCSLRTRNEWPT